MDFHYIPGENLTELRNPEIRFICTYTKEEPDV